MKKALQLANLIMPFITMGIDKNADPDEIRDNIAKDIHSLVGQKIVRIHEKIQQWESSDEHIYGGVQISELLENEYPELFT